MDKKYAQIIVTCTQQIRELMGQCSILSIAQIAAWELFMLQQKGFGGVDLHSPYRQICHILGLALTTPEPNSAPSDSQKQWEKAKKLSTKIFGYIRDSQHKIVYKINLVLKLCQFLFV